jgi:ComF family protein
VANPLLDSLARLMVPPVCACCGSAQAAGPAVCERCRAWLVALPAARCERCGAPNGGGRRCVECRGRPLAFASAWAAFAYNAACRRLVGALKSRRMVVVARFMAAELAARAPSASLRASFVPVPAHRRRTFHDGFNPAGLVAHHLGAACGQPVVELLRRSGRAPPQATLGRAARLRLSPESFVVRAQPLPAGPLVLVDDVYTTGATADACARVLRAAGAQHVMALAFARAVRE